MEEGQLEASNLPPEAWPSEVTVSVTGEPPNTAVEEKEETAKEAVIEISPEITKPLSILDVLRISAVLEDTIDQLSILNYIMPVQYEKDKTSACGPSISVGSTSADSSNHRSKIFRKKFQRITRKCIQKEEAREKFHWYQNPQKYPVHWYIKKNPSCRKSDKEASLTKCKILSSKKPTRQTIMNTETLKKIQIDRQFFSDVITETMEELQEEGTFTNLLKALGKERESKMHFYDIIAREENGRKKIKSLQKQLLNVKKERQAEVQNRNEYIAHLKDQLQEMKAKTNMENRYMKRNTELQISQTQKKCSKTEELLLEEIEKLRLKTEEENRIHAEIEVFLRKEQQKLEEKLEFWMEKFDKDTEMKQNELNALKSAKASDLAHLQELAKTIREYEQVIIEDRIEKEKTRKKREQDDLELRSIIKLQAWWRGTVVRREIGGFKMPKDKDDSKDGKGKGKGKGKEKDKRRGKK